MSYSHKNLSLLGYANGFTLWHYRTADHAATVDTEGYMNAAADLVRVGDFIMVNFAMSDAAGHGLWVVNGNDGGVVSLAALSRT